MCTLFWVMAIITVILIVMGIVGINNKSDELSSTAGVLLLLIGVLGWILIGTGVPAGGKII